MVLELWFSGGQLVLNKNDLQGDMDRKMKKISEDRMQLSPVSVLEAALSNEESPVHISKFLYRKAYFIFVQRLEPLNILLPGGEGNPRGRHVKIKELFKYYVKKI